MMSSNFIVIENLLYLLFWLCVKNDQKTSVSRNETKNDLGNAYYNIIY